MLNCKTCLQVSSPSTHHLLMPYAFIVYNNGSKKTKLTVFLQLRLQLLRTWTQFQTQGIFCLLGVFVARTAGRKHCPKAAD